MWNTISAAIQVGWHWLTTTRYTRRLEQEIRELQADNDRLRGDNDGLLRALYPAIRAIRSEKEVRDETKAPAKSFQF